MPDNNQNLLIEQQELTRLIRALHILAEKQLSIQLADREELLSKKQLILDELAKRDISNFIKTALDSKEAKCRAEAGKQIEMLHAIEKLEAITLDKWYQESESGMKEMQNTSSNQKFKNQYKDNNKTINSRFLDGKDSI